MPTLTRHHELGSFLRSRRERLQPTDVKLPAGGRRRTPGLRREEVAQLAGVGVTWYTWLEQGRDINPSAQVLGAIAQSLLLNPDETRHLFTLAGIPAPPASQLSETITAEHLALLDQLLPFPACFQTARFDVLAYNRSYRFLIGDFAASGESNCLVHCFLDPEWAAAYGAEIHQVRRRVASRLRSSQAKHLEDPLWQELIGRLGRESAEFRELWSLRDVMRNGPHTKTIDHPRAGVLRLKFGGMWLDGAPGVRFTPMTPADGPSATALARFDEWYAEEPRVYVPAADFAGSGSPVGRRDQ
ncbi:helix-turn-helix transcriptional regulator [Naumannella cuiyingiana]|uniref:Transcriptional regulator with XRE-family HTH domain n=1 Tax=Naumannella cuiyingiana TaxID=1347891 RepID=A0A7Z0IL98_9ACTN|nr:helix-turn-helix transcriptional regulator [Naumannella cuiyingiana]NYI71331.1 transcriptional regulator with XRE-family HTH domain [Naumannella cuiyingiana]